MHTGISRRRINRYDEFAIRPESIRITAFADNHPLIHAPRDAGHG